MKLNLSIQKNDREYRFTSYGEREDLLKILEAFQAYGALTVFCALQDSEKKES